MCNCGQCLEHVDCECPTLTGTDAAQIVSYVTNIYTPAQSISGAGFDVVLYTNSSAVNQTVLIETNMYLINTEPISVTTTTYKRSTVALTGAGVAVKEKTPSKTDHTHFLPATVLTPGQNISITIVGSPGSGGSAGTPTLKWLKSVVYKY